MTHKPKFDEDGIPDYTKPAFIRRIQIRGYKSIQFCDVQLHPLTVLVGRNASGKSNFLDALGFISDLMEYRVSHAIEKRNGWKAIHCQNTDSNKISFEIDAAFESENTLWEANYQFSIGISESNHLHVCSERLQLKDGIREFGYELKDQGIDWWGEPFFKLPDSTPHTTNGTNAAIKLNNPLLARKKRDDRLVLSYVGIQPFVEFENALRFSGVYNPNPSEIRKLQLSGSDSRLSASASNLTQTIREFEASDHETFERVKRYLRVVVPEFHDFYLHRYGDYETIRFVMKPERDQTQREYDASSMSDGTLRALATLIAVFQVSLPYGYPGWVGIEEPETAIHPSAMRALVDALDDATQRTQIIVTTHSPDLLEGQDIKPEWVLVVQNVKGFTRITPLNKASQQIVAEDLSAISELQRIDQLSLNHADLRRQDALLTTGD